MRPDVTAYSGNEVQASLSPDGKSVAFACSAPERWRAPEAEEAEPNVSPE
jgi:hypothetical protein